MLENNAARKSLRDFRAARAAPGKGYAPQHQRGQSSWAWDGEINWLDHFSAEDDSDTDSDSWPWLRDDINWLGHEATWAWDEMNWQWHGAAWSWHQQDRHGHYWQGASSGYQPQNQPHPLGSFGVAPLAPPPHPLGSFGVAPLAPPQTVVPNASGPVPRGHFGVAPVPQDAPGNPFPVGPQAALRGGRVGVRGGQRHRDYQSRKQGL